MGATGSAAPVEEETCSDCTTLPQIYIQAGGKCSDCPTWAKAGQCTEAQYSKFMKHYCAKSCGCPKTVPETSAVQMSMPVEVGAKPHEGKGCLVHRQRFLLRP